MEMLNLGWLRQARRNKRMTTEAVAKAIGKDRSSVWRYETGITDMTVDVLFKLLCLYKRSIMDVVMVKGSGHHACI